MCSLPSLKPWKVFIGTYVFVVLHTCTCEYAYMNTSVSTYIYMYIYIYIYIYTYANMYINVFYIHPHILGIGHSTVEAQYLSTGRLTTLKTAISKLFRLLYTCIYIYICIYINICILYFYAYILYPTYLS
jgi:hypothetical protein